MDTNPPRDQRPADPYGENGASILHYVAGHGTREEIQRLLDGANGGLLRLRDFDGRTPLHWAAIEGNCNTLRALLKYATLQDINACDYRARGTLHLAMLFCGKERFPAFLEIVRQIRSTYRLRVQLRWGPLSSVEEASKIMRDYCDSHDIFGTVIRRSWGAEAASLWKQSIHDMPPFFLALCANRSDLAALMQSDFARAHLPQDAANVISDTTQRSALHWAVLQGRYRIVVQLCRTEFAEALMPNIEEKYGKTALQYAREMGLGAIEVELWKREDVKEHTERLNRGRQDCVNEMFASLQVGVAILILIVPIIAYILGASNQAITSKYEASIKTFCVFMGLSFQFGISSTLLVLASVPLFPRDPLSSTVHLFRRTSSVVSYMLAISIVLFLGAFIASALMALPSLLNLDSSLAIVALSLGTILIPFLIIFIAFAAALRRT